MKNEVKLLSNAKVAKPFFHGGAIGDHKNGRQVSHPGFSFTHFFLFSFSF
jgi:hypothetical protein